MHSQNSTWGNDSYCKYFQTGSKPAGDGFLHHLGHDQILHAQILFQAQWKKVPQARNQAERGEAKNKIDRHNFPLIHIDPGKFAQTCSNAHDEGACNNGKPNLESQKTNVC